MLDLLLLLTGCSLLSLDHQLEIGQLVIETSLLDAEFLHSVFKICAFLSKLPKITGFDLECCSALLSLGLFQADHI